MDYPEINARLTDIFREVFADKTLELRDDMTADDVAKWDSLSHINMIFAVEKAFGVKFSIKDTRNLKNVGDLVQLIKQKSGG
jgi:acyl carrier protein